MNGRDLSKPLFNGVWWQTSLPDASVYVDNSDGSLSLKLGGVLATVPTDMREGKVPLLIGKRGFYVEFETSLSDNDPDHFPAVWLMPIEHNSRREDSYPPDEPGFERWLEIDIDEGGFAPGPMATAIHWHGKWPNYNKIRSSPNLSNSKIDRTQKHRFGASFDPNVMKLTFWHNDQVQYVASKESVPEVALKQHFYVIMNAASRKARTPYTMNIYRVRAFVPE
ncbi:hypothetical protein [Bradyrhizobium sp. AC87j1]|uniref:hypothetical protein n=1 Tax=Bradyrhizobium sp. AC87j1 TaxID=2055894 RepID=UPI0011B0EB1C|nr:hypothetical protein [Bradyrhizobium sp. AC87j1]